MRKEIDPKIQAAAKSYAARFSGNRTAISHFITFWREAGRTLASIDYDENRARSWAYQSGGECYAGLMGRR